MRHLEGRRTADQIKALLTDAMRHPIRFGTVTAIDPTEGLIMCELEEPGHLTGWIPYLGLGMPFGPWRAVYLPPPGTEVILLTTDPETRGFIAIGGLFNGLAMPPVGYEPGSVLLQHQIGTKLLLSPEGTLFLGGRLTVDGDPAPWLVQHTFLVTSYNDLVTKFNSLAAFVRTHIHADPQGGTTGVPVAAPTIAADEWDGLSDITVLTKGV